MSTKKQLQNLVWDGLFNSLDPKIVDENRDNAEKKDKKTAKIKKIKGKTEDDHTTD